ncbi:MAG: hypothetical protein Q9213_004937 [Squamulea squamosa]
MRSKALTSFIPAVQALEHPDDSGIGILENHQPNPYESIPSRPISTWKLTPEYTRAVGCTVGNSSSSLAEVAEINAINEEHWDIRDPEDIGPLNVRPGKTDDELITDLGDLTWLAANNCHGFRISVDLSCRRQRLMKELDRRASKYTQDGLLQQLLHLRAHQHRVQTVALISISRANIQFHQNLGFDLSEELAELYKANQNYFQAELILEDIALMIQAEGRTSDAGYFRIITKLVGLYVDFRSRIRAIESEHDDMALVASQLVIYRIARINSEELCNQVYHQDGIAFETGFNHEVALHFAAKYNAYHLARRALDQGAVVDGSFRQVPLDRGEGISIGSGSPLHIAVEHGSIDIVKLLVARGFDIEAPLSSDSNLNDTPLHKAAVKGSIDILAYLVSKGADIEARRKDQKTPLILAASKGTLETVQYLLERGVRVNSVDASGYTALHWATITTRPDVLRLLLVFQADIMARSATGWTALHCTSTCTTNRTAECIGILIDGGLDVDAKDHVMETALHKASQRGNYVAVKSLLDKGAASTSESPGGTPLHHAVSVWNSRDRLSIVLLLLQHSCKRDTNIKRSYDGRTPLHAAVRNLDTFGQTNLQVLELLWTYGADVNVKDSRSKSSLDYANDHEAARSLLKQQLPVKNILHLIDVYPKVDCGRDLVACGANTSITHAQRAARRPKRHPPVKIKIKIRPVDIRQIEKPSTNSLVTRLGDLNWMVKFASIDDFYEHHWQAGVTELKRRASEYTRTRQTQRSLYLLEQLHHIMTMRSTIATTSKIVPCRGRLIHYYQRSDELYQEAREELAKLYECRGNLFQAELILEEILIMSYETLGPRSFCKDVNCSRIITELVRLYRLFFERLGAVCAEVGKDHDNTLMVLLIRVARVDINEISNRVLFHEELDFEHRLNTFGRVTFFNVVLHIAAEQNACNLAAFALNHGADIDNILDSDSYDYWDCLPVIPDKTPLHTALDCVSPDMAKLLITRGAELEAGWVPVDDDDGLYDMPLHKAVSLDSMDTLCLLLSRGADVNARGYLKQTPFVSAAEAGDFEAMQLLFKYGADVNSTDIYSSSALHYAASWPEGLKFLLGAKASVGARNGSGQTALHLTESVECIDLLLSAGLEVDIRNNVEETALHKASREGNLAVVQHLLSRGASPSAEGSTGEPLHQAVVSRARLDRLATVNALLQYGANTNSQRPSDGKTPLHVAAVDGGPYSWDRTFLDILEVLCAHGADVSIQDSNSLSALDYVRGQQAATLVLMRYLPVAPVPHQRQGEVLFL